MPTARHSQAELDGFTVGVERDEATDRAGLIDSTIRWSGPRCGRSRGELSCAGQCGDEYDVPGLTEQPPRFLP